MLTREEAIKLREDLRQEKLFKLVDELKASDEAEQIRQLIDQLYDWVRAPVGSTKNPSKKLSIFGKIASAYVVSPDLPIVHAFRDALFVHPATPPDILFHFEAFSENWSLISDHPLLPIYLDNQEPALMKIIPYYYRDIQVEDRGYGSYMRSFLFNLMGDLSMDTEFFLSWLDQNIALLQPGKGPIPRFVPPTVKKVTKKAIQEAQVAYQKSLDAWFEDVEIVQATYKILTGKSRPVHKTVQNSRKDRTGAYSEALWNALSGTDLEKAGIYMGLMARLSSHTGIPVPKHFLHQIF